MLQGQGHAVKRLVRVCFGPISLGETKEGSVRELSGEEVASLKKAAEGGRMRASKGRRECMTRGSATSLPP